MLTGVVTCANCKVTIGCILCTGIEPWRSWMSYDNQELMEKEGIFYQLVTTQQQTTAVMAVGGGKDREN